MKLFENIKEAINNKFFKEVTCSHCGAKGKVMLFRKLKDDSLICSSCYGFLPKRLKKWVKTGTLETYKKAFFYAERSKKEYKPIFNNDAGFHMFEVDSKNLLFKIFGEGDLILPLSSIDFYNFSYKVDEEKAKENPHEVKGDVELTISLFEPEISFSTMVAFGIKTLTTKKSLLGRTFIYDDPEELKQFKHRFSTLLKKARSNQQAANIAAKQQAKESNETESENSL